MLLIGLGYCSHRFHLDLLFQWKKYVTACSKQPHKHTHTHTQKGGDQSWHVQKQK